VRRDGRAEGRRDGRVVEEHRIAPEVDRIDLVEGRTGLEEVGRSLEVGRSQAVDHSLEVDRSQAAGHTAGSEAGRLSDSSAGAEVVPGCDSLVVDLEKCLLSVMGSKMVRLGHISSRRGDAEQSRHER
jgi:hypothetical protein